MFYSRIPIISFHFCHVNQQCLVLGGGDNAGCKVATEYSMSLSLGQLYVGCILVGPQQKLYVGCILVGPQQKLYVGCILVGPQQKLYVGCILVGPQQKLHVFASHKYWPQNCDTAIYCFFGCCFFYFFFRFYVPESFVVFLRIPFLFKINNVRVSNSILSVCQLN